MRGGTFGTFDVPKLSGSHGAALADLPVGLPVLGDFAGAACFSDLAEACDAVALAALPDLDDPALRGPVREVGEAGGFGEAP